MVIFEVSIMEDEKYLSLTDEQAKQEALALRKKSKEEIVKFFTDLLDKYAVAGVKIAIETLELVKEEIKLTAKENADFQALCSKTIDLFRDYIKDNDLTEQEKQYVLDMTMKVVEKADESNKRVQEHRKEMTKAGLKYGVAAGTALSILSIFAIALSKNVKK